MAAVFSRRDEDGERVARVASERDKSVWYIHEELKSRGRTDRASVGLHSCVEVLKKADCVRALGDNGAGDGQASQGEDGEVCETHGDELGRIRR